jgi:predicted CoA-binding protein
MTENEKIIHILENSKTVAVVGFSRRQSRAGHYVPAFLHGKGYRIIPINPHITQPVWGEPPYASLDDVPDAVDLVLIFQRSENVPPFVDQAVAMGAKYVWMQLGIAHDGAKVVAENAGIPVVMDKCALIEYRKLIH